MRIRNKRIKLVCLAVCIFMLSVSSTLCAFADSTPMPYSNGTAAGTADPMTPDAGSIAGTGTNGAVDSVSGALDSMYDGVSSALSSALDGSTDTPATTTAQTTVGSAMTESGGFGAAAVIIFIIIAIAIVALVMVLVPRRRD